MLLTRRSALLGAALGGAASLAGPRPAAAKEYTSLRVATEGAFPPYNATSPSGQIIGFEPELLAELSKRLGIPAAMQAAEWNGMIAGLNDGKFDAIMAAMSITPKREEVIAFSLPYASSPSTFLTMKGSPLEKLPGTGERILLTDEAKTRDAVAALAVLLRGKTVGVQVSTIQADFLNTYLKDVITVRTYPTSPESLLDLKAGRVDVVIASGANLVAAAKRSRGEQVMAGFAFTGGLLGRGSAIGLRKEDTALKAKLDDALRAVHADGTLTRLIMKHFDYDITPLGVY
ncbi:transporter substrate-binding domain-containing protein [Roseomonas sp. GC11]|uniref:transporter substrate-binding domain-containing protein n=1 Tax=Roseomonas sp. GC11 TaxID=2950546 RepID=UPI00210B7B34|nr:transporter substrate-binding domain-containing protein [Roseomonas sp. GC11]MCQ4161591.1 transporter substrate-binding domain-containing protein [Roseomonas sp. GC11]